MTSGAKFELVMMRCARPMQTCPRPDKAEFASNKQPIQRLWVTINWRVLQTQLLTLSCFVVDFVRRPPLTHGTRSTKVHYGTDKQCSILEKAQPGNTERSAESLSLAFTFWLWDHDWEVKGLAPKIDRSMGSRIPICGLKIIWIIFFALSPVIFAIFNWTL